MSVDVFLLLKVPHVSASAAEDTTFRIFLHSVFMGPFLSGLGLLDWVRASHSDKNDLHNRFLPLSW